MQFRTFINIIIVTESKYSSDVRAKYYNELFTLDLEIFHYDTLQTSKEDLQIAKNQNDYQNKESP